MLCQISNVALRPSITPANFKRGGRVGLPPTGRSIRTSSDGYRGNALVALRAAPKTVPTTRYNEPDKRALAVH